MYIRLSLFIALIIHILRQLAEFMPEIAVLLGGNRRSAKTKQKLELCRIYASQKSQKGAYLSFTKLTKGGGGLYYKDGFQIRQ